MGTCVGGLRSRRGKPGDQPHSWEKTGREGPALWAGTSPEAYENLHRHVCVHPICVCGREKRGTESQTWVSGWGPPLKSSVSTC